MAVHIPLFPLNAVLFPHMPMALHIFEDRYKQMMRDCLDQGTTFGVVAIREGREVGPSAKPHSVGTLAQMRGVDPLPDGRYNIVIVGASRFHIDALSRELPYLTGEITYMQDAPATPHTAVLAQHVARQFTEYVRAVRSLSNEAPADVELPDEPELLSYLVAAALQIAVPERQRLLEIDSADERLRMCQSTLRREHVLLENMLGYAVASAGSPPLN
ncbi:MAG TPA: LON peptidase substrate-binding domain-containing protein [Candidatus Dormibacteraeota bacterium]